MDEIMSNVSPPVRPQGESGGGSRLKRARTQTNQDITHEESEDEELIGPMSDEDWTQLEEQLQTTTTVISFSMTEASVEVDGCRVTLQHLRRDILEVCRESGVEFTGDTLTVVTSTRKPKGLNQKTKTYLSGHPKKFDSALWCMLKPGYMEIAGVRIWIQPMFTGRRNTNLTLNELEYVNSNRVTFVQLHEHLQEWGATDCLVVSHSSYVDQNMNRQDCKRSACDCLQVAAYTTDIVYSFRLFFPSENEANKVFSKYKASECVAPHRFGDPLSTMILKPVPQAEWDRERGVMYRPGVADEEVFKIGIFGVRIEMRSSNIEDLFVEHSLGQVQVEIRGSQPLFAIGTCSTKAQMDKILAKFGPGKSPFTYKNIRMYLRRWESTPPGRGIPGRLDRRRANIPSRTAGDDGGQIESSFVSTGQI
ncbi:hypothetical protein DVH05_017481 [Phytophthora capsici]|nr:hypothetical protein DVH05_017481 [Phytophthora capsici]